MRRRGALRESSVPQRPFFLVDEERQALQRPVSNLDRLILY